ncbi:hypothetical protein Q1695_002224 [Nippostrongylus brasiliensis]|nr:hypothetical protein Q1695_002224 [Nippostrongylus brasiliensis]
MLPIHCILLIFAALFDFSKAACFHCVSSDVSLEPRIRTHLGTQEDIFFMPLLSKSAACSAEIESDSSIEGQICSSSSECVTLTLNFENSTFAVRGCMEYILRHSLKIEDIHEEGCYVVRSLPSRYPNNFTMEYILCVCIGDYCNRDPPLAFQPGPLPFKGQTIIRLRQKEDMLIAPGKGIQLVVSSSNRLVLDVFCMTSLLTLLL